jgi:probable O-glycosylation ligase (exosortase A-associated)
LLLAPQTFFPALGHIRIGLITAALAMGTYLLHRFTTQQPILHITRETWITIYLAGWTALTVPLSYWPGGSASLLLDLFGKALAVFWLLGNLLNTLPRLRQAVWALSLMAIPLAAFGIHQYLSGHFIPDQQVTRIVGYEAPLTANPNDLALMLNLILPLSMALFLMVERPGLRMLLLAGMALNGAAVILTFSRGGLLTLMTTVAMYLWRLRRRPERRWVWAALVVALLCIPLLPASYVDRVSTITDIESDPTGSSQARWQDTLAALSLVAQNPLIGTGLGMNILALNSVRGPRWKEIHNVYLQYAVDLGIPGLVLFLLLFVGCIRAAGTPLRRAGGGPGFRDLRYLAEGIQISLIAFAVAGLVYPAAYHFYFYYIAGLAVAVRAAFETEKRRLCP